MDNCTKESIQIEVDTTIQALYATPVLDQIKAERGLPKVIRTYNARSSQVGRMGCQELDCAAPGRLVQEPYNESSTMHFGRYVSRSTGSSA